MREGNNNFFYFIFKYRFCVNVSASQCHIRLKKKKMKFCHITVADAVIYCSIRTKQQDSLQFRKVCKVYFRAAKSTM